MPYCSYYTIKIDVSSRYSIASLFQAYNNNFNTDSSKSLKYSSPLAKTQVELEYLKMNTKKNASTPHDERFNISGVLTDGYIRLFKLNGDDTECKFFKDSEKESEIVQRVFDKNDVFACVLFENTLSISEVLKTLFPSKNSLTKVTHIRALRQIEKQIKTKKTQRFDFNTNIDYTYNLLLINFKTTAIKDDFIEHYNGFEMHDKVLKVIKIKEVVFSAKMFDTLARKSSSPSFKNKHIKNSSLNEAPPREHTEKEQPVLPFMVDDPFTNTSETRLPAKELPLCPVCLDRMDSSTTGLITTNCQHAFHCDCLIKWNNSKCPVCRNTLESNGKVQTCDVCNETKHLWCCLLCGNIGCSRYSSRHAIDHYRESGHCFSIDMDTSRVWDYVEDKYVHRLVQNISDGKLVEISENNLVSTGANDGNEKSNTKNQNNEARLEYIQVLVSQLESQQTYYEEKLKTLKESQKNNLLEMKSKHNVLVQQLEHKAHTADEKLKTYEESIEWSKHSILKLHETVDMFKNQMKSLTSEIEKLKFENAESEEKNRDLMLHLEAMNKLNSLDSVTSQTSKSLAKLEENQGKSEYDGQSKIIITEIPEDELNRLEAKKRKNKKKKDKRKLRKIHEKELSDESKTENEIFISSNKDISSI